jgi:peptide/nickel transport system permease protein
MSRRILLGIVTVWAVSVVSFLIIIMPPGDFVTARVAALQASGDPVQEEEVAHIRRDYGLDQPIFVQYYKWASKVLRGNLGVSMQWERPVMEVVGDRLWLTAAVALAAVLFTWLLAIPIGIYSAVKQYSVADYTFTFVGFIGLAVPNFLLALVLLYVGFAWFDASIGGLFSDEYIDAPYTVGKVWDLMKHLVLPGLILAMAGTAELIRIMRANLLDELRKPYVVTARAKGVREWRLVLKYPVRLAINPLISVVGWSLPQLLSGSLIVATVLSLPTAGPMLLRALLTQDMFLAGTFVLLLGSLTLVGTLISDILLFLVDPRIRLEEG